MRLCLSILRLPVPVLIIVVTCPTSGVSTTDHLVQRGETTILYVHSVA
jgi:hypothetical protein